MSKLYTDDSIETLDPLSFTRLRPQVYVGDCTYSTQLLIEIISNAVDEYRAGNGNVINIIIDGDIVSVEDFGQGFIPNLIREDNKTVLEAAFSVLNTSGKYREDGSYEGTSLGSFGIGSKICNFLSNWLNVITYRDNKYEQIWFKEGIFEKRKTGTANSNRTGTYISWKPSKEFFTHTEVEVDKIQELLKTIVCLCSGLTINFTYNGKKERYYSEQGLNDLVSAALGKKEIVKNRFCVNFIDGRNKMDFILTYTSDYSFNIVPYVNTGLTERGPHITQIKAVITREFNRFFKEKRWIKDNLSGDDIQEGMHIVFNLTAPNVAYDAQVKNTITKIDMSPFIAYLAQSLQRWFAANERELKTVAEKALTARRAREAAKKAKEATRGLKAKKSTGLKAKMQLSNKFIDCTNKNPRERNLLLVEGLSAGSAAIEARNPKTDCIYMLRGKILSTLKCNINKIFANQELSDIIKIINAGFGKDFDITKADFNKVIITSDQDSDGLNIELLLITFFYTYMRPLVEAGMLYRAVTPLYIIRQSGKEYYCYSDNELEDWKKFHKGNYDLLRAKG